MKTVAPLNTHTHIHKRPECPSGRSPEEDRHTGPVDSCGTPASLAYSMRNGELQVPLPLVFQYRIYAPDWPCYVGAAARRVSRVE